MMDRKAEVEVGNGYQYDVMPGARQVESSRLKHSTYMAGKIGIATSWPRSNGQENNKYSLNVY